MVSEKRLSDNFAKIRQFSLPGAGVTRLAFSEEDWQARAFVIELMEQAGLSVRIDAFGNVIGRREGALTDAAVVMMGSHIDSVPSGGNYDGVVGVLSAIEVINCLNEEKYVNEHPIEVVVFMAEESSRFGVATLASKVMAGHISVSDLQNIHDKDGNSLYGVLQRRDLPADNVEQAKYTGALKAFVEVHIEQGKVLEVSGKKIGLVTGIAAPTRLKVLLSGHADHSGATPMGMRSDALCAAAEIVLQVEKLATATKGDCVGTVGVLNVQPCVMNVIPGSVEMGIDIRSIYSEKKNSLIGKLVTYINELADKRKIAIDTQIISDELPVQIKEEVIAFLANVCKDNSIDYVKMPSGAGHDAMYMAELTAAGMIFIPCKGGVSHHQDEFAKMEDIVLGTKVLCEAIKRLAKKDAKLT